MPLPLADIQGLIVRGYGMPFMRLLFLRVTEAATARKWLRELVDPAALVVTTAEPWMVKPAACVNVAFSAAGLLQFGLPEAVLRGFSPEFEEGAAARAELLGDVEDDRPELWDHNLGTELPHVLLLLHARDRGALEAATLQETVRMARFGGLEAAAAETGEDLPASREHFGFQDGISQPQVDGFPGVAPGEPLVAPGEFLLGEPNELGVVEALLTPELMRHGCYFVYRKLRQDVVGFRSFLRRNAGTEAQQTRLGAQLVGRWPDGVPLVLDPQGKLPRPAVTNAFLYGPTDAAGALCPLGAHIRRCNPRDDVAGVNRHRLLRRGMPYGPALPAGVTTDDGVDRGLLGLFLNANIRRQFEFILRAWARNPGFRELRGETDVLLGAAKEARSATLQSDWDPPVLHGLPRFTTVRGAGYFFAPGIGGLRRLAAPPDGSE